MKSFDLLHRHAFFRTGVFLIAGMAACFAAQEADGVTFGAAGWMQYSVIGNSSEDLNATGEITGFHAGGLDGKGILAPGAQISIDASLSEKLRVSAGLGVAGGSNLSAGPTVKGGYAISGADPFVSHASFTYRFQNNPDSKIFMNGGLFSYDYNPDAKNLGLYLLRGPVYPGILISGFETKHVMPVANMLGLQVHHQMGGFQQDFILSSETEFYPFFDLSPAYVASYQVHKTLRIGAGVNFYHLIPVDSKLTSGSSENGQWMYIDSAKDTTQLGFNGTKLMANASFDPKPFFDGSAMLGSEDLKLYGEVALIGLDDDKAHRAIYGDYLHRMPVMAGFNLPAFKQLDHLSLEVEWYGAGFADNLDGYNIAGTKNSPSPYPTNWKVNSVDKTNLVFSGTNVIRDNWKWSLHGAKTIQKHVLLSFQIANDHYRPGIFNGYADSAPPLRDAVLTTPKDWYFTTKLAYFF